MIRLNLLPPGVGAKASPFAALPWRPIGIGLLSLLVVYSGWIFFKGRNLSGRLVRLTAESESLQPQRARLDQTQAALQALKNRDAALKVLKSPEEQWAPRLNLLSDCIVSDLWFSGLMFRVTRSTEIATFLNEEFKNTGGGYDFSLPEETAAVNPNGTPAAPAEAWRPQLLLRGFALVTGKEGSPVSRFLERLKGSPAFSQWFNGVELKDVAHSQVGQQEISEFSILLYPTGQ